MTQEQFKQEAQRLRPWLVGIARRYLGDTDEAEDTVQDVLLHLWQLVDELRSPLDALARVLTRNRAIDILRRRKPQVEITAIGHTAEEREDDERMEQMMRIIEELPPTQQTIIRLRHMEGMEMSQIATLTGMSEVAVRKALSRARQAILLKIKRKG